MPGFSDDDRKILILVERSVERLESRLTDFELRLRILESWRWYTIGLSVAAVMIAKFFLKV